MRRAPRTTLVVLAICALALLAGFALKAQCLGGFDGRQYSRLCYNDLQALFEVRGIADHVFPYVDGSLAGGELTGGAIEYPVLTGVFMWASGLPASSANDYLVWSALLLAPFALLVAFLLARLVGRRALMWAAAPALVLYSFHNWDLLVVAAAVAGLYLWWRGHPVGGAVAFGIGGALKLYPLLFLAPLVLELVTKGEARKAWLAAASGAGSFAIANLPFVIAGPTGWWATYAFHSRRGPNFDSVWQFGWPQWSPSTTSAVSTALLVVLSGAILAAGWRLRSRHGGIYPMLQVSGALLAGFMLLSKVHSPQYTLWILPFFVLLGVPVLWWIAYSVVDLMVYVGVFRWFFDVIYEGQDFTFFKALLITGVWARAALLALLVWVFLASRRADRRRRSRRPASEPRPTAEHASPA